jgi:hypothetical protein
MHILPTTPGPSLRVRAVLLRRLARRAEEAAAVWQSIRHLWQADPSALDGYLASLRLCVRLEATLKGGQP